MLLFETGKKLEKAFTREQFDALVEVLESRRDKTAPQDDLSETGLHLKLEIEKVRSETEKVRGEVETTKAQLQGDIAQLRIDTLRDLRELEMRMVIKLGGMLVVAIGLLAAVQKLL